MTEIRNPLVGGFRRSRVGIHAPDSTVADFRAKSAMRVGVSARAKPEQNGGAVEEEVLLACALSEKDMTAGFSLSSVLDFTHFKRRKRERLQLHGTG